MTARTADPELNALHCEAAAVHLSVLGGFHAGPEDVSLPRHTVTLLLLGPLEPAFWPAVSAAAEFRDGAPDPLDRWSRRTIGGLAEAFGATALYPFDGPPYLPFFTWLTRTGRAWRSPVSLLVHAEAGLFLSVRGALALPRRVALPVPARQPCEDCDDRPCLTACPVGALGPDGYDVRTCHGHLDTAAGDACLTNGCAARRACPVSQAYPRRPEQSAFHMRAFHRTPCDT